MRLMIWTNFKVIYKNKYLSLLLRVGIGAIFLLASIGKLGSGDVPIDIVARLKILQLLRFGMIRPVLKALPWFELVLGLCFLLGLGLKIASAISLPLISAFIAVNILDLQGGLPPCPSCFGNLLVVSSRNALIIDVFLLLATTRILTQEKHFISLDSLWERKGV